jgi:hypothetical protein
MRRVINSEEAGARADSMLYVSALFIAAFSYIALTTNPVYTGIAVEDRAPEIEGKVNNGGNSWTDFSLTENYDESWNIEEGGGTWFAIEFMDINCGHCKNAAEEVRVRSDEWMSKDISNGDEVEFLAVSLKLGIQGDEYNRDNIKAFRENYEHNFQYLDDLDNSNRDVWDIPGTPTYFLIAPNGIIMFASPDSTEGETLWQAMDRIIPTGG